MSLEEKKILGLLNKLGSAELLFISQEKAVLVLDGAGVNGPRGRECFEVDIHLDHDEAAVLSATVHRVTPFKPGYVKLDGDHDLDGGALFHVLVDGWGDWWPRACEQAYSEFNGAEHQKMLHEELKRSAAAG
ncbi:hypothetical protein [Acidithiobacillus sp.]